MANRTSRTALTVLVIAALAACGGSDDGDDAAAGTDDATETSAAPDTTPTDDVADDDANDVDTGGDAGVGAGTSAADCTATGQVTGGIQADLADADVVVNPGIDDTTALYDVTLPDGEVITFFAFSDQPGNAVINTGDPDVTWSEFASPGIELGTDLSGGTFDITLSGFDGGDSIDDVAVVGEISCA